MSENTQRPSPVINFVKIKSWYVPADAESYQLLRSIKVPLLKVHQDFIPTLKLATEAKGIRAKSVPFSEVLSGFLDRIGSVWLSKPGRKCKLSEHRSQFTCPSTPKNRKSIAKLDSLFQEFTSRWGHSYAPVFSETPKELKLVLDYKFDPQRQPLVPSVTPEVEQSAELILGFTKIKITFDVRRVTAPTRSRGDVRGQAASAVGAPTHILEVFTKAGTDWVQVHTASFTHYSMGDLLPFLSCLGDLHNQQSSIPV